MTSLGIKCYLCDKKGHITVDCGEFCIIKGNLKKHAMDKIRTLHQSALSKMNVSVTKEMQDENDSISKDSIFTESQLSEGKAR